MLVNLSIRDMLLIERAELRFGAGLNVLTGETGAGKSILLDSLGFVLGRRGRADMLRQGAAQGEVIARFELPPGHGAAAILAGAGLPMEGGELILRRLNLPDGRKRAWVNDRPVSAEVLRALGTALVEVHGQHDDRGLLNAKGHRALLDAYGENAPALAEVAAAWKELQAAQSALEEAEAAAAALQADADYLHHALAELEALAPEPGEDATLDARRRLMQSAERLREGVARAAEAQAGAEGLLLDATRWLEDAAAAGPELALEEPVAAMGRVLLELGEAQAGVVAALARMEVNPHELEQVEERLFALRALARKHKVLPDDLPEVWAGLQQQAAALESGADDLAALRKTRDARAQAYQAAAAALTARRKTAAARLDAAMAAELAPLKMENARFSTRITPAAEGPEGADGVSFQVATNPGAPAGPIGKIASGGELSRFLLALKVCLTTRASGLTLIFDEIDRGVGGATADAVGRRLAALARGAQVLVVTHSPQVAAMGQGHFLVSKSVQGGVTRTEVQALSEAERLDEIARMLAGNVVSQEARAAARALLQSAAKA